MNDNKVKSRQQCLRFSLLLNISKTHPEGSYHGKKLLLLTDLLFSNTNVVFLALLMKRLLELEMKLERLLQLIKMIDEKMIVQLQPNSKVVKQLI